MTAERELLRVAVVSPAGVIGGAESYLLGVLDHTERLSTSALLLDDGPLRTALHDRGVPCREVQVGRRPRDLVSGVRRLAAELRAQPPDVVLANGVKAALVAAPAGLLAGVPVVWVKHDHSYDGTAAAPLARLCTRVIATVEEVAEATRRSDVVVVPPARAERPPLGRPAARARLAELGVALDDRPTAAIVGRLVDYKGVDDAVRAMASAAGWRLVVIGADDPADPGTTATLERLVEELGIRDRVQLAGEVAGAGALLAAFEAVLVLTRPHGPRTPGREGFGLTAMEAMLAGVPVVAVEGSAVARRLAGGAGVVVPAAAPAAVAAALEGWRDPGVRRRAGERGREQAIGHPGPASTAEAVVRVLAAAAARPGAGRTDGPAMTVVVPVLNEGPGVPELLTRLVPQLRHDDELLIVDGGSTDGTQALVRSWPDPRVRLLEAPGTNIPAARNAGFAAARTAWVAATDAGCVPVAGWLSALRSAAADGAPELVTGVYRVVAQTPFEAAMAVACYPDPDEVRRPTWLVRGYAALLGRGFDPALPTNRSNAVPVAVARAVGGYDEALAAGEDVSFGQAIVRAGGHAVLAVDAEVAWVQRPTVRATARMYRSYGRGDGLSGERTLIGRDLARLAAYATGAGLLATRRRGAGLSAASGAAVYLSLPLVRATRRPRPWRTALLVPGAVALKDLSKALGCLEGLAARGGHRP